MKQLIIAAIAILALGACSDATYSQTTHDANNTNNATLGHPVTIRGTFDDLASIAGEPMQIDGAEFTVEALLDPEMNDEVVGASITLERARLEPCDLLEVDVDGTVFESDDTPTGYVYSVAFERLETMASATDLHLSVCGDTFDLGPEHRVLIRSVVDVALDPSAYL